VLNAQRTVQYAINLYAKNIRSSAVSAVEKSAQRIQSIVLPAELRSATDISIGPARNARLRPALNAKANARSAVSTSVLNIYRSATLVENKSALMTLGSVRHAETPSALNTSHPSVAYARQRYAQSMKINVMNARK